MLHLYTVDVQGTRLYRLRYPATQRLAELPANDAAHVVVRWGNSRLKGGPALGVPPAEFTHVINPSAAIQLNCQKHLALEAMAEVVRTPRMYKRVVPRRTLVVVRPYAHEAGEGFSVQRGPIRIAPNHYATEFVHSKTEYRVWFCGDRTLCAQRVPFRVTDGQGERYQCRSEWGYRFRRTPHALHHATLRAAARIGLECGAADVMYKDRKYWFLELNTAPSVDHLRIRRFYQSHLPRLARAKYPHVHVQNPQGD